MSSGGTYSTVALPEPVLSEMWGSLPGLAERTVGAVVADVPSYADAFSGPMGLAIEKAVQQTLAAFLRLLAEGQDPDASHIIQPALDGAFTLGQGEARQGRSTDVLLAAYRVGARTAWRQWSSIAVTHAVGGDVLAVFAERIFAYIDRLSALSVSGHADELARSGLDRQRHRELLARRLMTAAPMEELVTAAERAQWQPPRTLTAVAVPGGEQRRALTVFDNRVLEVPEDATGVGSRELTMLLIPDVDVRHRRTLIASVLHAGTVIGPTRPWSQVEASVRRVARVLQMRLGDGAVVDTEQHLTELVVGADSEALADLRAKVLAPLDTVRPAARQKLVETLRAWLLHQGRREEIATALIVHPQTVRYRLTQLRHLFGDELSAPQTIEALTIALAGPTADLAPHADQVTTRR